VTTNNLEEMLLSLETDHWSKLVILNLETREEKVVIKPEPSMSFMDIIYVPGIKSYYILHTSKGI